jgi:hypothetical protein
MYDKEGASYQLVADNFNEQHLERSPIDHSTVKHVIKCFTQTGNLLDRPCSGRTRSSTDNVTTKAILGVLTNRPKKSMRKLSEETGVSRTSV